MTRTLAFAILTVLTLGLRLSADDATTQRAVIDASDKAAVDANMDKEVIVRAEVEAAEWSQTGKVMRIEFKDCGESKLLAVIFLKNREAMDKAFEGDIGKALTGAKVKIEGKIEDFKGRPEIRLDRVTQITVIEPEPATKPSS